MPYVYSSNACESEEGAVPTESDEDDYSAVTLAPMLLSSHG